MAKDTLERSTEPDLNVKAFLADAYLHPIFRSFEEEELSEVKVEKQKSPVHDDSSVSELSSPSPPHIVDEHHHSHPQSPPHYIYHPQSPPHFVYPSYPPHQYAYSYDPEH